MYEPQAPPGRSITGDPLTRLAWGASRLKVVLLALLIAVGTAVALLAAGPLDRQPTYRTSALVIATDLAVWHEQMPRLYHSIFHGGAVATGVSEATGMEAAALIPGQLRIEPVEGTLATEVVAEGSTPEAVVALANAGASVFVAELNRLGPGIGSFTVHSSAPAPTAPEGGPSPLALALAGLGAALVLWLGLAMLWVISRNPVLSAAEAAGLAGVPVLGSVGGVRRANPDRMPGLGALARRLYPRQDEHWAVASCGRDDRARAAIVGGLHRLLGPTTQLSIDDEVVSPDLYDGRRDDIRTRDLGSGWLARLHDAGPARGWDLGQRIPPDWPVALVVESGAAADAVATAAAQFAPGTLAGIVFAAPRGAAPGGAPGVAPGVAPGAAPGVAPGAAPGAAPPAPAGATPGNQSTVQPTISPRSRVR